jgi:hypothetical protein
MDDVVTMQEIAIGSFAIRDVLITIEGITPYSPSRALSEDDAKEKGESWDDFEARVWRKKAHVRRDDKTGEDILFIPGSAFKLSLDEGVQNINEKIQGKGNQTYTGIIKMGIAPLDNLDLGIPLSKVQCEKVYCHANGKRAPGPRVMRWFPIVHKWGGKITMRIFNDSLTQEKFEEFFAKCGLLAGVGRGRPSTGCPVGNGRYRPTAFLWTNVG